MQPFVCPVCHGRSSMPSKFYHPAPFGVVEGSCTIEPTETCRTCHGQGIVWAPCAYYPQPVTIQPPYQIGDAPWWQPWTTTTIYSNTCQGTLVIS